MNIFVLDKDPVKAAQMHCDKHCVKMVLELYQQLGSALRRHGATDNMMPKTQKGTPLKGGYHNHPCTRWVGDSRANFDWACDHAIALAEEYTYRYGKRHKSQQIIEWCVTNKLNICDKGFTEPPKAMPDECKLESVIDSYRNYYIKEKKSFAKWKNRDIPEWFLA